ncbi:MAG: cation:proton antiporter [Halobacteriota archaeon]|nr:cation:proton antiporter [Halobacteriota archaeon]
MEIGAVLLKILIIIVAAKFGGEIASRLKQPEVLGELIVGVVIGYTAIISPDDQIITTLAELGIILFLFHIGLDSNINELLRMGRTSLLVACIGVGMPFVLGYVVALQLFQDPMIALFIGATLTATSIAIPAVVLSNMGKIRSDESRVIIGAAVIDDILGLLILTITVPLLNAESLSFLPITRTILIAVLFLAGSYIIGAKLAPYTIRFLGGMKASGITVVSTFAFSLSLAYLANFFGLATVVGGFFAGLILAQAKNRDEIYEQTAPLTEVFTPIFFVMMGMSISVETLNLNAFQIALIIAAVAIIGKMLAGMGALRTKLNKFVIGSGMVARGEVALIFISFGLSKGVITSTIYSSLVLMVIITAIAAPLLLRRSLTEPTSKKGAVDGSA